LSATGRSCSAVVESVNRPATLNPGGGPGKVYRHATGKGKGSHVTEVTTAHGEEVMPSVFDVLSRDHQEVKHLLSELESGPAASAGASPEQLAQRKKAAQVLVIEESRHEAAEQMYFWPAVRERLPDGSHLADQAISQEQEGKEVLDKLDQADAGDGQFESLLGEFIAAGRDHIAYEENQVWPKMRAALSKAEADELGSKIEQAKKTAPTRPHPKAPSSPGAQKSTGPAVAAADKARDAATGRGR